MKSGGYEVQEPRTLVCTSDMSVRGVWRTCYLWVTDPCHISRLNAWAPVWCLLTIATAGWYGHTEIIPALYAELPLYWGTLSQLFIFVICVEMFVSWLCVRYVDSSYSPRVHGEKMVGQTISTPASSGDEVHITEVSNNNDVTGTKNNSPSVIYVMSGVSDCGRPQRTVHPYWSWVPCIVCNHSRPPRCHHCALCRTCVLKRDHHCFFVGSCVGYRNMRHFIVFCFWGSLGCLYAAIHSCLYYYYIMYEQTTLFDMFPVSVHMRWCFGRASGRTAALVTVLWSLVFFFPLTFHFLYVNMDMIVKGQTSFERDNNIRMLDCRSIQNKLRSVFGRYWYLNIIIPLHRLFPAQEDPVYWPDVHP